MFASEFEPNASKVYALNHGIQPHGDITLIYPDTIPDHDILCGGFPCQPFSIAGNQKGFEDTRGTLFFNVAKIIDIKKPKVCILENVPNILTHDKGNTVAVIANTLKNLGYDVYISTLNSNRFNSAQSRNRAYFVAIRADIATQPFKFPVGAVSQVCVADIKETGDSQHLKDAVIKQEQAVLRTMEYPVSKVPKIVRIGQVNQGGQGERIYHENGYAITLLSNCGGLGGNTGMYLIDGVVRRLTPRECARLQCFPESFVPDPVVRNAKKQFGNAVCVNVVKAIAGEVFKLGIFD